MSIKKNILCIVAHPDDEALGPGGALIKHSLNGDSVNIIILSEGEVSKSKKNKKNPNRRKNAETWSKLAGINSLDLFDFPDQQLDKIPQLDLVRKIEKSVENIKPSIVYIHYPNDINKDHQIAAAAALAAIRPISYHGIRPEIRSFETPSSTEQGPNIEPFNFKPNLYISIEEVWKKKVNALEAYSKELKKFPHPRSVKYLEALSIKRGTEVGLKKAEAFYLIRKIL
ncbi:MAG: GlcNAc-PI de-N-acetylase [Rickettsiales bacterium]|nr:GlcNAc-PI de-N-acetylase [Rickettsiales bacterium]MBJ57385.1 GlcNAc-PI de-N-acetylase [Rickettsiales bacterium]|tara:strand:- start:53 stop:733 length:681 start_codon:yes stop_codon:yes gene_type:complete